MERAAMPEITDRGSEIVKFTDVNGVMCSIQQSSAVALLTNDSSENSTLFLWLGCDNADPQEFVPGADPAWRPIQMPKMYVANTRMHLDARLVKMLVEHLQSWLETGSFSRAA